jgi:hypothetical protein
MNFVAAKCSRPLTARGSLSKQSFQSQLDQAQHGDVDWVDLVGWLKKIGGSAVQTLRGRCVGLPRRPEHSPHTWQTTNVRCQDPACSTTCHLCAFRHRRCQMGSRSLDHLLCHARAADSTMLATIGTLASQQSQGTRATRHDPFDGRTVTKPACSEGMLMTTSPKATRI